MLRHLIKVHPDRHTSNGHKYRASKTLAERAAWDFTKTHGASLTWDLTVLNPPLILGPILHEVPSPSLLNTSALQMYNTYTSTTPGFVSGGGCWVDVRDIALMRACVGGEEGGGGRGEDHLDATPEAAKSNPKYQKGKPGSQKDIIPPVSYDASKSGYGGDGEGCDPQEARFPACFKGPDVLTTGAKSLNPVVRSDKFNSARTVKKFAKSA
ncbi:hypothetical protein R3P38DRAFT_2800284 [Favolaschia claudopus]|uniref:Uncharacterized protein n=1 Tax=Favolaschia claudopus TaxID=2862362 RepID=A0AAV9ZY21_9AGAR